MRYVFVVWLLSLASSVACERSDRAHCALEQAALVAQPGVTAFDGVALATRGSDTLAAWSDVSGTWLMRVGDESPQRIGERCAGGIALTLREALWLACARLEREGQPGEAQLIRIGATTRKKEAEYVLGSVGREARGVALASSPERVFVAWGDGRVGAPRVLLQEISLRENAALRTPARALSPADANGREPSLLFHAGQLWMVWTESDLTPGNARHRLMIARAQAAPRKLAQVHSESPMPTLAADERGVVLAFRAAKKPGARPELLLTRLTADLRFAEPPHSIGRANGLGGPSLAFCARTRGAAVPIDHAGELYVAFHPLSHALRTTEENHQYYESGRELVHCALACRGEHPVALLAEQTEAARPKARLLRTEFRCSP